MSEWWRQDVTALARALRGGALSSEALLDLCLERIARLDPALNSFVAVDAAAARAAARDSDARLRAGAARSALEGVPVSVKDNLLAAGLPATWGSIALRDFVPAHDEIPVARLRAAGAVILGKTNVPELTVEGYTANALFGVTRNPWNPRLTPGGSSGGAVAGVAAGLVPAALGTDGGGSIRRPASHTGLVGFKPSTGRIARVDGFPAIMLDFEVVGPITRTVADAALFDSVLAGPDARDRASHPPTVAFALGPRRIRHVPRFGAAPVDAEVAAATQAVADALAAEGHAVEQAEVFFDLDDLAFIWRVVTRAGVGWMLAREGGRLGAVAGPSLRAMAEEAAGITGADYSEALHRLARLRRRVADLFAGCDLVLTPTAAALPWPAEQPFPTEIDGRPAGPRDHAIFTGWANAAGVPALSLPVAMSRSGLPIGVQFAAPFGADAALLAFAAEVERRFPPIGMTPTVS